MEQDERRKRNNMFGALRRYIYILEPILDDMKERRLIPFELYDRETKVYAETSVRYRLSYYTDLYEEGIKLFAPDVSEEDLIDILIYMLSVDNLDNDFMLSLIEEKQEEKQRQEYY
jgi:hypothetical protein